MKAPESKQQLATFFSQEEFVASTVQQITKDLIGLTEEKIDFQLDFNEDVLQQLIEQLSNYLQALADQNLNQFIYRVDLSEKVFNAAKLNGIDFQEIAFLVIRREAQKVFLRAKFA